MKSFTKQQKLRTVMYIAGEKLASDFQYGIKYLTEEQKIHLIRCLQKLFDFNGFPALRECLRLDDSIKVHFDYLNEVGDWKLPSKPFFRSSK